MTETARRAAPAAEISVQNRRKASLVLTRNLSVGAGLKLMLANAIAAIETASQRVAEQPARIHRFRVVLRRLRSLLSAFGPLLPSEERRALSQRLGSVARSYAPAREWDVFLASTVKPMAAALPDEPALLEIESAARAARQKTLPEPGGLERQAAEIVAALKEAGWLYRPRPEFTTAWEGKLDSFVEKLLEKRHRRVRKHVKTVDLTNPADFHPLRVEGKKIRYPVEMFRDLFDEKAVDAYLEALIALQDLLGRLHDAAVARGLAAELPLSSRAQGVLQGWIARDVAANRDDFKRVAKRLRRATPFWDE